jgi:hypothetical protein
MAMKQLGLGLKLSRKKNFAKFYAKTLTSGKKNYLAPPVPILFLYTGIV